LEYNGVINIINRWGELKEKEEKKRKENEKKILEKLDHFIDKINDLYRYSESKKNVMQEFKWSEWVKNVNKEVKSYLTCGSALDKVNRIIKSKIENSKILLRID
jgi:hypothetical protein